MKDTREKARQILRNGILDMSIGRLIQMAEFGLKGNITLFNRQAFAENVFNRISYDEEDRIITFSVEVSQARYGAVSFSIDAISDISGCEDEENPEEYLHVNIKLKDKTNVDIKILY